MKKRRINPKQLIGKEIEFSKGVISFIRCLENLPDEISPFLV